MHFLHTLAYHNQEKNAKHNDFENITNLVRKEAKDVTERVSGDLPRVRT